jgi:L-ornithine Nalpha-acyltransferase
MADVHIIPNDTDINQPDFCFYNENCQVRLARSHDEIIKAQELRYHVFYEIMNAKPSAENARLKRDIDGFDDICDHLLVIDTSNPNVHRVVGNYRLLCADVTKQADYFYSHQEYNLENMLKRAAVDCTRILELGRSCVHPDFRSSSILQMLWRGIVAYAVQKQVGLMFGCASFSGTDISVIKNDLAYLHHYRLAPDAWRATARNELYVNMHSDDIDKTLSDHDMLAKMPPLIKGYLRLGAWVGDGAVIDQAFSTTDILIILPVSNISKRYLDFLGRV